MFDILAIKLPGDVKPSPSTKARQVLDDYEYDIVQYLKWKNDDVTAVASDDLIVSILTDVGSKMGYDMERSISDIYNRAFYLTQETASAFGLTYSSNAGDLHTGVSGNPTIYILGVSPLRKGVTPNTSYRDIIPVRYLSHDSTNIHIGSQALLEQGFGIGFDVIEIDLGLLFVQFLLWLKEQMNSEFEYKRSLMTFVSMHVWPKLVCSRLPLAFMNRARAIAQGIKPNNVVFNQSKFFNNRTPQAHAMIEECVKFFLKRENTFDYLLGTLPVPTNLPLVTYTDLPDVAMTRQVSWAAIMARYNTFQYLYEMARVDPIRARRFPLDNSARGIQRAYNDRAFGQVMGLQEQRSVRQHLGGLLTPLGK